MIAFCGLTCTECPAYLATREDDDEKRAAVAEAWSAEFHMEIKPEDVNCDGCLAQTGRLISHCHVCAVRQCARNKALRNCGYCNEYPCPKLKIIIDAVPAARNTLDGIMRSR